MKVKCYTNPNHDWIVEVDGCVVKRFTAFDRDSVYYAARFANDIRRGLRKPPTFDGRSV